MNFWKEFKVDPKKQLGYERMVGIGCEHRNVKTTNDGNRTQQCIDCGKTFVFDTPKAPIKKGYGK